jgi:hypothetical protein
LTSFGPGRTIAVWAPQSGGSGFALFLVAAAAGGGAAVLGLRPSTRRWAGAALAVTLVCAAVGVASIARRYPSQQATDPVSAWAASVPTTSIGAWTGDVAVLYGAHAHNHVVVLARVAGGAAVPLDTCQGWKEALVAGHFPYTAVIAGTAWARWLRADPAFRAVAHDAGTTVFQIVGPPAVGCPGQTNAGADFWLAPGFGI